MLLKNSKKYILFGSFIRALLFNFELYWILIEVVALIIEFEAPPKMDPNRKNPKELKKGTIGGRKYSKRENGKRNSILKISKKFGLIRTEGS